MEDSLVVQNYKSPLTLRAILIGIFLGALLNFLSIYLSYKIGISALGGTFILGYLLLRLTGKYNYKENAIVIMITGAMMFPAFGISGNMAALVVFQDYLTYPIELTFPLLIALSTIGSFLGLILLYPMKKQFLELKWPMILPTAQIVKVLEEKGEYLKKTLYGLIASAVTTITTITAKVRTLSTKNMPSFIGFEISPLMVGVGYFITFNGSLLIFIGSLYSIGIWYLLEGAIPNILLSTHIMHPAIFSIAIPMLVTTAIFSVIENRRTLYLAIKEFRTNKNANDMIPAWLAFLTLIFLPILAYIVLSLIPTIPSHVVIDTVMIIIIALPIVFISAIFLARARGETGFSMSFTVDIVLILAAIFLLPDLEDMLIAFSILGCYEFSSIIFLSYMKFGQLVDVHERDILKAILIGLPPGIIVSALTIWAFQYLLGGLGTETFPTPNAYAIGGYILGMLEAIRTKKVPLIYDPYLVILSIVFTILLILVFKKANLKGITPIPLAIGMLIPPSYASPILIGGILELWIKTKYKENPKLFQEKNQDMTVILSGVIGGEGIVLLIITLFSIIVSLILL
ncbi:MAG: OPT/YSL family transporter [Candidatus Asgardarchaeia archaeon]